MFRPIARVATLAVVLAVAATLPLRAQEQKGTLVFAVESLGAQTLDPILEGRPGNAVYQAVMYDSLVGFDLEKGGVGPGVAERWEIAPDGLAWTFFLRPVEADQRIVHHRLVDRIARPAFEDRIERLGAQRFDGEDKRALLVLSAKRRRGGDVHRDGENCRSPDVPEHKLLPKRRL